MLKPADILTLEIIAQDTLSADQPFDKLAAQIEPFALRATEDWSAHRMRKFPVGAALGHLVADRILRKEEASTGLTSKATELSVYDAYLALTEVVDRAAGEEVVTDLCNPDTLHAPAFKYYVEHTRACMDNMDSNKDLVARRGKVPPHPAGTAENALVDQVAESGRLTIPSLLIREAVRLGRLRGELWAAEELTDYFRHDMTTLADQSTLPGQLFISSQIGRELASERVKQLRMNQVTELGSSTWLSVLNQTVSAGALPVITGKLIASIEGVEGVETRAAGYCPAQFYLKPYESSRADRFTDYFAEHGIIIDNGRFRMADYQLLRCIKAASVTLFADSEYRSALQAIIDANTEVF